MVHYLGAHRTGLIESPPPVWAICGFCRWAHQPASQLFHRWYFPIDPLSYVWLGIPFAAARCGHLAPAGCSSSFIHTIIYDVWSLSLAFPGPDYKPNAICPLVGLHNHGELGEAVLLFAIQTVGQGLVSASAQTSNSMG